MPVAAASLADSDLFPAWPSSFINQDCAPGFRCVSKVAHFGLKHDGVFEKPPVVDVDPRYKKAYEWGCPARGTLHDAGFCDIGDGKSADSMCFSTTRYETGPNTPCDKEDLCMCVKPTTRSGSPGMADKNIDMVLGEEVQYGKFDVMPKAKCEVCADLSCNPQQCHKCPNCEYNTQTLAGRKTLGCFDVPDNATKEDKDNKETEEAQPYLDGDKAIEQDLQIVPHYRFWDPYNGPETAEFSPSTPLDASWKSRRDLLPRDVWLDRYVKAAPRIQFFMDSALKSLKDDWHVKAKETKCQSIEGDHDWALDRAHLVEDSLRTCREMQMTAMKLVGKDARTMEFDENFEGTPTKCIKSGQMGKCKALNCYGGGTNLELRNKIGVLTRLNHECKMEKGVAPAPTLPVTEEEEVTGEGNEAATTEAGGAEQQAQAPAPEAQTASAGPWLAAAAMWHTPRRRSRRRAAATLQGRSFL